MILLTLMSSVFAGKQVKTKDVFHIQHSETGKFCTVDWECDILRNLATCNRDWVDDWEQFTMVKGTENGPGKSSNSKNVRFGDVVAIKSNYWGRYCSAENDSKHTIHCSRVDLQEWEQFQLFPVHKYVKSNQKVEYDNDLVLYSVKWEKYCSIAPGSISNTEMFCDLDEPNADFAIKLVKST